ncbi:Fur family transcriptional regulator [Pelotomaculum propionicicum]|uniref:Zinc-specific metallo-regulatory protein n=1 Tax=Pelotomaculum propionicicum TaxID=258475 RepID=A0A4Y7RM02_9FIRM|nr:Fur family transcriptional regulator [Pelotomaculum propionicicum]NLI13692.1 transcriptional repressor [Peptococcaceae bacterium]TEB10005.1 Zinc-specific metallo-regulatory protein [Pelotomaculum propionicicum]
MNQLEIIDMVKGKGFKITPQRRAIIEALFFFEKPPTAKEVLEIVRKKHPEISLDTVYRNLNLLAEIDCLIQINLKNSETSRFEIIKNHHHHLICLGCGEAVCLESCILDRHMGVLREKGYQIVGHAFEIYGYCPACRTAG